MERKPFPTRPNMPRPLAHRLESVTVAAANSRVVGTDGWGLD